MHRLVLKGIDDGYYNALDKAHTTEDYKDFVELVAKEVEASLDLYLSAI